MIPVYDLTKFGGNPMDKLLLPFFYTAIVLICKELVMPIGIMILILTLLISFIFSMWQAKGIISVPSNQKEFICIMGFQLFVPLFIFYNVSLEHMVFSIVYGVIVSVATAFSIGRVSKSHES